MISSVRHGRTVWVVDVTARAIRTTRLCVTLLTAFALVNLVLVVAAVKTNVPRDFMAKDALMHATAQAIPCATMSPEIVYAKLAGQDLTVTSHAHPIHLA